MAPATRREARLSASLQEQANGQAGDPNNLSQDGRSGSNGSKTANAALIFPNVEHILENFEAFKRKHIAQNREIIKTNALAQMRIRELENKIETLETEREAQALSSVELRAKLSQLEHVVACVQTGWGVIGQSLGRLDGRLAPTAPDPARYEGLGLDLAMVGPEPQLRASNRITLDPSALPAGVVRSVARAPEAHLLDVMEDDEDQTHRHVAASTSRAAYTPSHPVAHSQHSDWPLNRQDTPMLSGGSSFGVSDDHPGFHMIESHSLFDDGGPPSPMSSPGLPMDLEHAIAVASRDGSTPEWRPNPPQFSSDGDDGDGVSPSMSTIDHVDAGIREALLAQHEGRGQAVRRTARRSSRRQSGLLSPPMLTDDKEATDGDYYRKADRGVDEEHGDSSASAAAGNGQPARDQGGDGDSTIVSPPLPLDQRAISGPILSAGLMTTSSILREVTNGVKHTDSRKEAEADTKNGLLQPTPRRARRQKMEPDLVAKKASIEDLRSREPSTPGGVKRKMASHDADICQTPTSHKAPASPSGASDTSVSHAAMASEADATFGRARRTRKSVNYALPKLNTKMRKPDPVDLIPATPGSSAAASRNATPSSTTASRSSRRVGSTGNLHDLRRQREAAASRSTDEHSAEDGDDGHSAMKRSDPDDEDGNAEGGSASLADLFETNPPRGSRTARKRTPQQAASDSESAGSTRRFWRTESNTDTSDDESRAMSVSDVGDIEDLEGAMSALSTLEDHGGDDKDADYQPSGSGGVTKSDSSGSMQSSSSTDGIGDGRRPSLRRRSTAIPPRATTGSDVTTNSLGLVTSSSSESIAAAEGAGRGAAIGPLRAGDASGRSPSSAIPDTTSNATPTQPSSSTLGTLSDAVGVVGTANKAAPTRTITTRRSSAARLTAVTRPSERPKSAGNGASRTNGSSSSLSAPPSSSSPTSGSGPSSLGRASGNPTAGLQRGGLHAALTNQPRSAGATGSSSGGGSTPQMGTQALPSSNSPIMRASPLLGGGKTLRPSASTSSLATATTSSGRSSPALSISSTNSSGSHASAAVRATSTSSTSALARTTTTKQATMAAAAAAAAAATSTSTAPPAASSLASAASSQSARAATSTKPAPHPSRSMPSLKRAAASDATPRPGTRVVSATQSGRTLSSGPASSSTTSSTIAATTPAQASTPSSLPSSSSAPRITVRSTPSTSSMGSERSTASSTATIRPATSGQTAS
ncbi:uncharacterized protein PFL1_04551 [Pseudozyma flocculosa PF-1]|uniref:Shugoshin C-terminal domain-containing protein n=2 Tax=Pseudozyma flocculosa TaxID=84751 RepID=A0A5C3FAC6_9BASI|nr:uncharacterized protein PFL1_04551 [Pseudozyma flocculosa PF-1]EPQ27806.1 hypothetical protein PFL1_04551 [Pseudozyma flocculosa PF-1]SPO41066.1 uncharacterized protein PSFLO_06548 [Pseudozyma flocculosa]